MKYKAKSGFELKDVAGELLLMPRGADTVDYNYVTVFNEDGILEHIISPKQVKTAVHAEQILALIDTRK